MSVFDFPFLHSFFIFELQIRLGELVLNPDYKFVSFNGRQMKIKFPIFLNIQASGVYLFCILLNHFS